MARVYYDQAGQVIGVARDLRQAERDFVTLPAGNHPDSPLHFNATANPALFVMLVEDRRDFRVVGGVLQYRGAPVDLEPDDADDQRAAALLGLLSRLEAGNATATQVQAAIAMLVRLLVRKRE